MKFYHLISIAAGAAMLLSCSNNVKNPITIESPVPTEEIDQVTLTPTQKGYVEAGNRMAFRLLGQMFKN